MSDRPRRQARPPRRFAPRISGQSHVDVDDLRFQSPLLRQQELWRQDEEEEADNTRRELVFEERLVGPNEEENERDLGSEQVNVQEQQAETVEDETFTHQDEDSYNLPFSDDESNPSYIQEFDDQTFKTGIERSMLLLALLVAFVAIAFAAVPTTRVPDVLTTLPSSIPPDRPPCFKSDPNPPPSTEESNAVFQGLCDPSKDHIPCPQGGTCTNGHLQSCNGALGLIPHFGRQCILSDASNKIISKVYSLLAKVTANHFCALQATRRNDTVNTSIPFFNLSRLAGEAANASMYNILSSSNDFVIHNECIRLVYSKARAVTPYHCCFRIAWIQAMERVEGGYLKVPARVCGFWFKVWEFPWYYLWFMVKENPLCTIVGFMIVMAGAVIGHWRKMTCGCSAC